MIKEASDSFPSIQPEGITHFCRRKGDRGWSSRQKKWNMLRYGSMKGNHVLQAQEGVGNSGEPC